MNCRDVTRLLSAGKPLDAQASAHLAACDECRALSAVLPENIEMPAAATMEAIRSRLGVTLKAVKPLPSNTVLVMIGVLIFVAFSFLAAVFVKLKAIPVLSGGQIALYYGAVLVFAGLFARATVERMIPAARRVLPSYLLAGLSLACLGILVFSLFQNRATDDFALQGIPCLRLGLISALLSALLGWRLLRQGYLVTPQETITVYGFFAGLVGLAVLALHCPILNSFHFLVWHLGAMLIAGCAGFLLGTFLENSSYAD